MGSMKKEACAFALGAVATVAVAACQHQNDAPTAVPVAAPSSAPAAEPPKGDTVVPAGPTSDAAAPPAEASPPVEAKPTFNSVDMTAAPAYPASNLYDTFSSPVARAKLIACYLPGKQRDPHLRGKVMVKFTIQASGTAKPVENNDSNLTDDAVIACVVKAVGTLKFPKPVEGSVTVIYPFIFRPTGDETLILPAAGKK